MKAQMVRLLLIVVISGLIGYYIGVSEISIAWKKFAPQVTFTSKQPPPNVSNVDFSMFWQVWQRLQTTYYDKKALDATKMYNGAISGMVAGLDDPYTLYLPPVQNTSFKQTLAGEFEGIGAELGMKDKQIIIMAPLDGSPAKKAGLKAGDAILKVDNKPTFGWTLSQIVDKIRGPKGSNVMLTIARVGANKAFDVSVVRDTITVKSVDGWVNKVSDIEHIDTTSFSKDKLSDKVMYMRLSQFGDKTNDEWLALVDKLDLSIKNDNSFKGAILDLRNNPGGYLTDATFIASEFISDGIVVIQDTGTEKTNFTVSRKGLLLDTPLIVLINGGSASASEIVSGALRDHKRAKLLGEKSFGKGTIQEAEDLGGGAGLHITIARWLTPNGTWVHGKGLTPDIEVSSDQNTATRDAQLERAVQELVK